MIAAGERRDGQHGTVIEFCRVQQRLTLLSRAICAGTPSSTVGSNAIPACRLLSTPSSCFSRPVPIVIAEFVLALAMQETVWKCQARISSLDLDALQWTVYPL